MPRSLFLSAFFQPGAEVWIDFLAQNVQCRVASGIPMNFRHVEKFLWSGACAGMLKHIGQCQCWNVRLRRAADRPTLAVEDGANENTSGSGIMCTSSRKVSWSSPQLPYACSIMDTKAARNSSVMGV